MTEAHHEIHLESHIVDQLKQQGWLEGDHQHYDRARALYPEDVIGWIQDTQPDAWEKLRRVHGVDAESTVLDRLGKTLAAKTGGTLDNENAIDLVFFINGLPVATVEIKTDFTQSVEAAKQQYRV
ncbi:type I restriction endonuclease, partial [Thiolapillus sp.]|uniref:type I restriction endonuclease n=1 Tax=Thiolapillus sp. TaxID=2017437 RepID=UPI003AF7EED7